MNFTKIYDEITLKAKECLSGSRVANEFVIAIFRNGEVEIAPADF